MTNPIYYGKHSSLPSQIFRPTEQNTTQTASTSNIVYSPAMMMVPNTNTSASQNLPQRINQHTMTQNSLNINLDASLRPNLGQFNTFSNPSNVMSEKHQFPTISILSMPSSLSSPSSIYFIPTDHPIPEFLHQLTKMLSDTENSHMISWIDKRIVVHDPPGLTSKVFHKYFRHSNYASFQRQLNYFGFKKVTGKKGKMHPCSYVHDLVTDDLRSLLAIKRKNTKKSSRSAKSNSRTNLRTTSDNAGPTATTTTSNALVPVPAPPPPPEGTNEHEVIESDSVLHSDIPRQRKPLHAMDASDQNNTTNKTVSNPICDTELQSFTVTDALTTQDYISQKLGFRKDINSNSSKKRNHENAFQNDATNSKCNTSKVENICKPNDSIPGPQHKLSQAVKSSTNLKDSSKNNCCINPGHRTVDSSKKQKPNAQGDTFQFPLVDTTETSNNSPYENVLDYTSIIMDPKMYSSFYHPSPSYPNVTKTLEENDIFFKEQDQNKKTRADFGTTMETIISSTCAPSSSETIPLSDATLSNPETFPNSSAEQYYFEFLDLEKDLRSLGAYFEQSQNDFFSKKKIPDKITSTISNFNSSHEDNKTTTIKDSLIHAKYEQNTSQETNYIKKHSEIEYMNKAADTNFAKTIFSSTPTNGSSVNPSSVGEAGLSELEELDGFSFSFSKEKSIDQYILKGHVERNDATIPTMIQHNTGSSNSLVH